MLVGVGALVMHQRQASCGSLLAYRLGPVDPRFGVSTEEVLEALRQAENLWEVALGRKLFTHDPSGPLVVSLVYDERQQTTQIRERLRTSMRETEASHAAVGRSYDDWRTLYDNKVRDYEDEHAAFQERAQAYNLKVRQANDRGGASATEAASLETERGELQARRHQLESDRVALEELGGRVRGLAEQGNAIADTHNRTASTFNDLYGSARQFHKGEYNGREITVFEFHDTRDFTLLLAHELGHVLGISHVDDPAAIMHAVGGKQVVDPLALAAADTAALKKVCGRRFF
jgi:hypothetical protein